ncbi:hypothetical protein [Amycolatopsis sp. NPDC004079]|uniref:hypothetical protein n=1 Tax=Amycolatopsis sp. NPDC004079 TaxID=3154549 RepID=UPI0033A599B2
MSATFAGPITRSPHPASSASDRIHRLDIRDLDELSPDTTESHGEEGLTMRNQKEIRETSIRSARKLNIRELRALLGRCGMSVSDYDIEYVAALHGADGQPAYGASPHDGCGRPLPGNRGRPLILLSDLALADLETAVVTIYHEIAHHRSYRSVGHAGTEAAAERYGWRMYSEFVRQSA